MLAYANGELAAFDVLYSRYRLRLFRFLQSSCGDADVADELYQNTWAAVIRSAASYHASAPFAAWIFRIARHQLIDHARRQRRAWLPLDETVADHNPAHQPAAVAEAEDRRRRIIAAVKALPDAQREAFLLREDGELSLDEIAALVGCGRETIKSRLRYAHTKLREALADVYP